MFLPVYVQKSSAVTHSNELYQALVGSDLTDYTNVQSLKIFREKLA